MNRNAIYARWNCVHIPVQCATHSWDKHTEFSFPLILFSAAASPQFSSVTTTELAFLTSSHCLVVPHVPSTSQQRSWQRPSQTVAAWCTHWRTWAFSEGTACSVLSWRGHQCCLTSSVWCLVAPVGTSKCGPSPPPPHLVQQGCESTRSPPPALWFYRCWVVGGFCHTILQSPRHGLSSDPSHLRTSAGGMFQS